MNARYLFVCVALLVSSTVSASSQPVLKQLVARAEETQTSVLVVLRDGKRVAEYPSRGVPTRLMDLRSATKSVVALAVGLLFADGRLDSLNVPIYRFFPEWNQGRKRSVTVRMLLNQTSGLTDEQGSPEDVASIPDVLRFALAAELTNPPGEQFSPSDAAANLLMALIGKASGSAPDEYIARDLFAPLGIQDVSWQQDSAGNPLGMTGLALRADDAAKLGQLVLDAGQWNGQQIIPESYISEMLNPQLSKNVEVGFFWTRTPAWIRLRVDEASLDLIRKLGVNESTVAKLAAFKSHSFTSTELLVASLHKVLSEAEFASLYESAQAHSIRMGTIFHLELGPTAAFTAGGEGEYIVIVPAARLVAVRLAEANADANDQYEDFVERVLDVAKSWDRSLKPR
jgi:CubicO group peptidase (beta-lactamase class C family)